MKNNLIVVLKSSYHLLDSVIKNRVCY